jgi:hypothetical protein
VQSGGFYSSVDRVFLALHRALFSAARCFVNNAILRSNSDLPELVAGGTLSACLVVDDPYAATALPQLPGSSTFGPFREWYLPEPWATGPGAASNSWSPPW